MSIRCLSCQAEQPQPAAGATSLCLKCGSSISGPAAGVAPPLKLKLNVAAPPPADGGDDDFSARTMSMVRPSLAPSDALPSLAALVASAHQEATSPGKGPLASRPPPPPPAGAWHVRLGNGSELGPAGQEELLAWRSQGRLDANTLIWRAGFDKWLPLADGLAQAGVAAPPPREAAPAPANDVESFLAPSSGSFESPSHARKTVVYTGAPAPATRPRWQLLAAGAGAMLVLAMAGIGAFSLLRSKDSSVAVTSAAPAPAAQPAAAAPAAPQPPIGAAAPAASEAESEPEPEPAGKRGGAKPGAGSKAHFKPAASKKH